MAVIWDVVTTESDVATGLLLMVRLSTESHIQVVYMVQKRLAEVLTVRDLFLIQTLPRTLLFRGLRIRLEPLR